VQASSASPSLLARAPACFVNEKVLDAATVPGKAPRWTAYVYVPAGAAPGTRWRRLRVTVAPAGSVTVNGPITGSRLTGPVTALHASKVWGCPVVFVSVTVNWKLPPSGPITTGGLTGSAATATGAGDTPV